MQLCQVYSFNHRLLNRQTQLVALSYSAISSNPKTVSVVSKMQFTHTSRSSHSWLSKQPKLVQSSKQLVASLSCPELGTAQPKLVNFFFQIFSALILGSWMIVRWLMVLFKIHRDAFYTPHVPIIRRDPQNEAKIQHKSINFKAFFNQVLENINTFFLNDC